MVVDMLRLVGKNKAGREIVSMKSKKRSKF